MPRQLRKTTKIHPLNVAKKMWKRIPPLCAVALYLGEKVKKLITLLDTLYHILFPIVFKIKTSTEKATFEKTNLRRMINISRQAYIYIVPSE